MPASLAVHRPNRKNTCCLEEATSRGQGITQKHIQKSCKDNSALGPVNDWGHEVTCARLLDERVNMCQFLRPWRIKRQKHKKHHQQPKVALSLSVLVSELFSTLETFSALGLGFTTSLSSLAFDVLGAGDAARDFFTVPTSFSIVLSLAATETNTPRYIMIHHHSTSIGTQTATCQA